MATISTAFNETTLTAIENYALSPNQPEFINSLPEGLEKNILKALTLPYQANLQEQLIKAGVPAFLANQIVETKIDDRIQSATSISQIQQIVDDLRKTYASQFNFAKPFVSRKNEVKKEMQGAENVVEKRFPSKLLTEEPKDLQTYFVSLLKKNQKNISLMDIFAIRNLPEETLLSLNTDNKSRIISMSGLLPSFTPEFASKFIRKYEDEMTDKQLIKFTVSEHVYRNLPIGHINKLAEDDPNLMTSHQFLKVWFISSFEKRYPILTKDNSSIPFSEKEVKRKLIQQILIELQKLVKTPYRDYMIKQLQLELLVLDLALEDPSLERFVSYLSSVNENLVMFNNKWSEEAKIKGAFNARILSNLQTNSINFNKFGEEYIEAILRKYELEKYNEIDNQLLQIFDDKWYKRLKAKVLISKGEGDLDKISTENQKLEIRQKKELTICKSNKGSFKVQQDVVLKIKVKNISKITVKIYELNLEKHYIQQRGQIQEDMDLHFLDPTYQFVYEVANKNPFKEQFYDMSLKQVKKERGVYFVDLDAAGISTRAVIRKGAIFCLTRITLAGVELKFYDESGKIIEELNIWLRGQLITVKGSYLIPFGNSSQSLGIIAVVGQYAEVLTVNIPNETYSLTVTPYINKESLILGSKAKIILNPRLFHTQDDSNCPQTPVSLKLLKNISIQATLIDQQNVKSVVSFENVKWSYTEDYVIEVPVQSYLRHISVTGTAEITKYNGTKQSLGFNADVSINFSSSDEIMDCYLKKVGQDYVVFVLGLDGEPIARAHIPIHIKNKWYDFFQPHDLESDDNGQVNLGPLKYTSVVIIQKFAKQWQIGNFPGTSQLFKKMCFREGEKIKIPLPPTNYKIEVGTDANFFSMDKQTRLQNLNHLLTITDKFVEIPGLSTGRYNLSLFSLNYYGTIVVIKGTQWENPNQIYNESTATVYEFVRNSNYYLTLSDPKIEQLENGNKVRIDIIKPEGVQINQNVKVHVMAYSFIPTGTPKGSIIEVNKNDAKYSKFIPKGNSYLCNKKLSEQATYVLNRKDQPKFVGNNLEKPHILLKRIKIRDTVQKQEQMNKQQAFSDRRQNVVDLLDVMGDDYNFNSNNNNSRRPEAVNTVQTSTQNISLHNNFLQHAGLTLCNFKNESIEFVLPSCYSFFTVFLLSNNSEMVRNYAVDKSDFVSKRLSHVGLPKEIDEKTAWSMSREVYTIGVSQCRKISRTSKWCAISLSNILRYAKTQGAQLDQWVERWSSYTWDFKLQIYNKKACHQLNTYIKHHDPEFFCKVVSPFIKNKINKRFVDLCLLEDSACEAWTPLQFFNQLNQFEKVLLIQHLAKHKKLNEAEGLANAMELQSKVQKVNYNSFKQKFEGLLNMDTQSIKPNIPPPPPPMQQKSNISPPPPPPPGRAALNNLFGATTTTSISGTTATFGNSRMLGSSYGASSGAALFGMPPMPPPGMSPLASPLPPPPVQSAMRFQPSSEMIDQSLINRRGTYVQQFKEVQNTSEYAEVTYDGVKDPNSNATVSIPQAKFWADLACHFARGKNNGNFNEQTFINESIMYLAGKLAFTLAACFLPKNLNPDYEIESQGSSLLLTANKPFLLLIKQIKAIPFAPKSGLIMNHRFIDPSDMYTYAEDGSRIEKEVDQFIYGKQYSLQTLVTNISSNSLQVQLLVDLPQGTIPLETKEYTQVTTVNLSAYSTQSFSRKFYFPRQGKFELLPANACWVKDVIAKAAIVPTIEVKAKKTSKKIETFKDMLEQGQTEDIVSYLQSKNIFDPNLFKPHDILWMLTDKQKFEKIVGILRERGFMNRNVWMFGLLHGNLQAIKELMNLIRPRAPQQEGLDEPLKVLEYYPYYSSRTHKYENANKAKIRNVEFKETYYRFLIDEIVFARKKKKVNFQLAAAYYLLLQDRIDEASKLIKEFSDQSNSYKLQFDYIQSFLDMYEGFPNFTKARQIVQQYKEYPISSWRVLFGEIEKTLRDYDSAVYTQEEQRKIEYRTIVSKEDEILRISLPENQRVEILLYSINLELSFSENPFQEIRECSSIRPAKVITYEPGQSRQERLKRPDDLKDIIVQVYESGKSTYLRKVESFLWYNPKLKVKGNEKTGSLQVFYQNKPVSGTYCKVYSTGNKGVKFYRDGYTDITGSFKYALSELSQINRFSVLCMSDNGGRICSFGKPSEAGELLQL